MSDDEKFPTSASERGDNAHIIGCHVYGGRRHYACCLMTLKRLKNGEPDRNPYDTACREAIAKDKSSCDALKMRIEEQKAGQALYYVPRASIGWPALPEGQIFSPGFERGFRGDNTKHGKGTTIMVEGETRAERKTPVKPKPAPTPRPLDSGALHAELVNKLVDEERSK